MSKSSELRAKARKALGGNIFDKAWLMALVACLVITVANFVGLIPVVGTIGLIVIAGAVNVGVFGYFLKLVRGENPEFIDTVDGFKNDFVGNFLLGFMHDLFICLWTLLFIIPGIIATYSYSMAYYIKNDHPEYKWNECLKESKRMMKGYKWKLFCLEFSFIGWHIVAAFVPVVGSWFVSPYVHAAQASFYEELKANNG